MMRSGTTRSRHGRVAAGLLVLLATLLVLPGRSLAETGDDAPPVVSNGIVTPGILTYLGGEVSVSADVTDDIGIVTAYAEVYGSDGSYQNVTMSPVSATTYSAAFDIPPNYTNSGVTYGVSVTALDTNSAVDTEPVGEIDVGPEPQFDEAPNASDPSVTPQQLPSAGGDVTIGATATDDRSVSEVYATVTLAGGGSTVVALNGISSSRYEGVFTAPANIGATSMSYSVEITALDDIGQPGTVAAGDITVAAPAHPSGTLKVWPAARGFGAVPIGQFARKTIIVRNAGPRGTPAVTGTLISSGHPFSLVGSPRTGVPFALRPGQIRTFVVQFRPTGLGARAGTISVRRADEGQAALGVRLTGRGVGRSR